MRPRPRIVVGAADNLAWPDGDDRAPMLAGRDQHPIVISCLIGDTILVASSTTPLELFFQDNNPRRRYYLDLESGRIIAERAPFGGTLSKTHRAERDPRRYLRIEPASPREQYGWMESFVASVDDGDLQRRLVLAMDGQHVFRRFKEVLLSHPREYERWRAHRLHSLRAYMAEWLRARRIDPGSLPRWGVVEEPVATRDGLCEAVTDPAEALRRRARLLIAVMPALQLPTAIAYLRFLHDKHLPPP